MKEEKERTTFEGTKGQTDINNDQRNKQTKEKERTNRRQKLN
jgi:hypothetical protein